MAGVFYSCHQSGFVVAKFVPVGVVTLQIWRVPYNAHVFAVLELS